jgi:superfamily II DNA or RNA helicase
VLYLCHSPQLIKQAEEALRKDLASISERLRGVPIELLTGTYSAVRARVDVDVLIVDECHRAASATGMRALALVDASWRIGMSGTPFDRTDGGNALVVGLLGPQVYHIGIEELTKLGFLTPGSIN